MRQQIQPRTVATEDREPVLRIWRRGLYLSPPQLKFSEQRPAGAGGGLAAGLISFLARRLRRG
jgi:hypothetical protein